MKLNRAFILIVAATFLQGCDQLTFSTCSSCEQQSERFFNFVIDGNTLAAYEALNSPGAENSHVLDSLISGTNRLVESNGKAHQFEKLDTEKLGQRVIKAKYILYHEKRHSLWTLQYYKAPAKEEYWRVTGIEIDINEI